jgi:uncharacterized protein YbaA (DUF1428 family)
MPRYVDGFLIPVPRAKIAAYRAIAKRAGKIWRDHGALDYKECVGEDIGKGPMGMKSFPQVVRTKAGETVVFSYIVFKSRAHRDRVNAAVMADPRMAKMMAAGGKDMPFDCKRMAYGGFSVIVDA